MVIDLHTRLPHGHLVNKTHDMRHHAAQMANCAAELRAMQGRLTDLLRSLQEFRDTAAV